MKNLNIATRLEKRLSEYIYAISFFIFAVEGSRTWESWIQAKSAGRKVMDQYYADKWTSAQSDLHYSVRFMGNSLFYLSLFIWLPNFLFLFLSSTGVLDSEIVSNAWLFVFALIVSIGAFSVVYFLIKGAYVERRTANLSRGDEIDAPRRAKPTLFGYFFIIIASVLSSIYLLLL